MSDTCIPHHDWFNALLTFCLCCGLVVSYLPQHYRIIHAKSSEGLSPVFLLLGTTSAASGLFNMITLQAPIVKCCRVVPLASCAEMVAGVVQLGIQWFCFSIIFVLYMMYYPPHLKYARISLPEIEELPQAHGKTPVRSEEWRLSIILAWVTVGHLIFIALTTTYLLATTPSSPSDIPPAQISLWATFLGVSSALLAAVQYAPQILHTYRTKLVGALSIPMMMIQTPGGILMVTSIVLRPGTNWTSWITFAVAAIMQGCLLGMCIAWKVRQRKLHIDDFGNPINSPAFPHLQETTAALAAAEAHRYRDYDGAQEGESEVEDEDPVPGLVTTPSEDPIAVRVALASALESAVESSLLSPGAVDEQTPLLYRSESSSSKRLSSTVVPPRDGAGVGSGVGSDNLKSRGADADAKTKATSWRTWLGL